MTRRRKPGAPKGVMPKNYAQFREAGKATHFAPGYRGQSIRQVEDTKHLIDWLDAYDNPQEVMHNVPSVAKPVSGEFQPCPPTIQEDSSKKPMYTHEDRVHSMLAQLRPSREKFLDNDPVSLVKNFKG